MPKTLILSAIFFCSSSLLLASAISLQNAPDWLIKPTVHKACALSIGSAKSSDPHAEAMILSTLEHSMNQQTHIASRLKFFKEDQNEIATYVSKISGETYSGDLEEKSSWKNKNGDLFLLTCQTGTSKINTFPFTIKSYAARTKVDKNTYEDRFFRLKVQDQVIIDSVGIDENSSSNKTNAHRPKWVDTNYSSQEYTLGIASIVNNDIQTAYIEAMSEARHEFAVSQTVEISRSTSAYQNKSKPNTAIIETNISKQIVKQTVRNSYLSALWIDDINNNLYILLKVDDQVDSVHSYNAKELWEKFTEQKQKK